MSKAREAPINTKLVGTGPYMVDEFKPGDLVVTMGAGDVHKIAEAYLAS